MQTPSKKSLGSANPNPQSNNGGSQTTQTQNKSQYEQLREDRIKENLERMQKLGIVDISLQLKSNSKPKRSTTMSFSKRSTTPFTPSPIRPRGPVRRSSRLQNATPVSYSEGPLEKNEAKGKKGIVLEEGAKPEIYTEEHEKLLGHTDKSWTLFVDGYGKDGKRIYDQVRGKTCHQCRQKTLGHHTHCSKCDKVQGQFCGDCLYMRYGEHVLEANQNPDWICPVCRGICNCSLCRTAKGWPPTGTLYKKISQLGFKSVAHYLIQTQRSPTNSGENPETPNQVSAKKSLKFLDGDASSEEILKDDYNEGGNIKPLAEHKKEEEFTSEVDNDVQSTANPEMIAEHKKEEEFTSEVDNDAQSTANPEMSNQTPEKRSVSFLKSEDFKSPEVDDKVEFPKLQSETNSSRDDLEGEKENTMHLMDMKPALDIEPNADSIARRLRQRCRKGNDHDDEEAIRKSPGVEILSGKEVEKETGAIFTALDTSSKLKKKRALAAEPSPDSIGGRLRLRRKGNIHDDANSSRIISLQL